MEKRLRQNCFEFHVDSEYVKIKIDFVPPFERSSEIYFIANEIVLYIVVFHNEYAHYIIQPLLKIYNNVNIIVTTFNIFIHTIYLSHKFFLLYQIIINT